MVHCDRIKSCNCFQKISTFSLRSSLDALAHMYTRSASSNTHYVDINKEYANGNMTRYLLNTASGKNLGYFNRHYFIAASFEEENESGKY